MTSAQTAGNSPRAAINAKLREIMPRVVERHGVDRVADVADVTPREVANWAKGKHVPRAPRFLALCLLDEELRTFVARQLGAAA